MTSRDWHQQAMHQRALQGVRKLRKRQRELQADLNRRRAAGQGLNEPEYRAVLDEHDRVVAAANHAVMSADEAADVGWH